MRKIFIIILVILCYGENTKPVLHNTDADKSPEFRLPPVNPEYIKYQEAMQQGKISGFTSDGHPLGYIPPVYQFDLSVHTVLKRSDPLPGYYDLREEGYITSVKDQGSCGACWAFASFGSVESIWLKSGYGSFDFSENNANCGHGFEWDMCIGGNAFLSSAYLVRGDGPILESDDPYYGIDGSYIGGLTPAGYVTGARLFLNDMDVIKQAIYDHGSLYTTLHVADPASGESLDEYMNEDFTYYYDVGEPGNHAVTLVGWDDSKYVSRAPNLGAWICKNSWGDSWGEDGYFYISYDDSKVNGEVAYWPDRKAQYNTVIYQYDELGMTGYFGWLDNYTDYALVKFEIENDEKINSIGTWVPSGNATVQIEIYDGFNGTLPYDLLGTIDEQSCPYVGYYTFDLESPIDAELISNSVIYVKVEYNTPNNEYCIPMEHRLETTDGIYSNPEIEEGVFWVSDNGGNGTWFEMGYNVSDSEFDPCVKVYSSLDVLLGDITQDSEINIFDIIKLIDIKQNEDIFCDRCDMNGDDLVNVLDVIDLLFIILHQ